jgi:pyridoxine 4-dehydrogenase
LFARLWPRIQPLLEPLADIARTRQVPQAAVALNWCRSHGAMPIVGLRTVEQAQLAAAASRWSLDGAERQALDAAARTLAVGMPANPFASD